MASFLLGVRVRLKSLALKSMVLFHMPILGSKTTISEMFALGQAESDFSIGIESYDWEMFVPLKEDVPYSISGKIVSADRRRTSRNHWRRAGSASTRWSPTGS